MLSAVCLPKIKITRAFFSSAIQTITINLATKQALPKPALPKPALPLVLETELQGQHSHTLVHLFCSLIESFEKTRVAY